MFLLLLNDTFRVSDDYLYAHNKTDTNFSRPWRSLLGSAGGFEITLHKLFEDREKLFCLGFAFLIHPSDQLMNHANVKMFTTLRYGLSIQVMITPEVLRADSSLKNLKDWNRKCLFENEGNLKYFKKYTKENCQMECVSEVAYKHCHCVPFNYIRNKTMDVCDISAWNCVLGFKNILIDDEMLSENGCSCPSSCETISYHYEVTYGELRPNFSEKLVCFQNSLQYLLSDFFSAQKM